MAHAFLRLMILELLHGNLHSSLQLWEMKMPSCLKALIRKWTWNGIVLSQACNNLFSTIELSWMEMCISILSTTSKQVLFCWQKFKNFFTWERLSNRWPSHRSFLRFYSVVIFLVSLLLSGGLWKLAFQSKPRAILGAYALGGWGVVWLPGLLRLQVLSWDPLLPSVKERR